MQKNFRSIFNENTDLFFYMQQNFRSAFNENTNMIFFSLKTVFSSLLQISKFKEESNLKLRHVNQILKIKLSM